MLRDGNPPYNLAVLSLGADRRTEPLVHTEFHELNAEISPDGRWLAYESDESGQREVFVRPFPNVDAGRWLVSNGGGTRPLWAKNGQELFYLAIVGADAVVMSVRVERRGDVDGRFTHETLRGAVLLQRDRERRGAHLRRVT